MEKGEGRELLKRYGMQVFPTYLLLDAAGNEVHRVVGGHDASEFIRLIREGMDPENSIAGMQKRYEQVTGRLISFAGILRLWGGDIGLIKFRPYWMSFAGKMERRLTKRTGS